MILRRFICKVLLTILLLGFITDSLKAQQANAREEKHDPGYIYAFTEATRLLLFEDYGRALNLFNECLKYEPNSPAIYYQLAQIYLKAGDISTARKFSAKAYRLDTKNVWYAMQLASVYQASRMTDSAIFIYKAMVKGSKEDLGLFFKIATLYEQEGKNRNALEYLDYIEKENGISREVCITRSRIYEKMGKSKNALAELRRCLTGNDEDYLVLGVIAEYFRNHHKPDSAEYYYQKILSDHANDANVVFSYGEFLLGQKKLDKARDVYIKAFKSPDIEENVKYGYLYNAIQDEKMFGMIRPVLDTAVDIIYNESREDVRTLSIYSDIKYRIGNYGDAARALKQLIGIDDKNYSAWEQLLFCENALGRTDSVRYYGELAVLRFPERPLPYLLLGSAYYEQKMFEKAIGALRAGENYAGGDKLKIEFYSLLAECFGKQENYNMSDDYYARSLELDSLNVVVLNNYAYSLAVRGVHIDKAIRMSRYTIEKEPYNATYLDTYAWVMYKSNNFNEADKYIHKAMQNGGSTNPEILSHLGDILAKKGRYKDALSAWNEALKYGDSDANASVRLKIENIGKAQ